jgi:hypothetical protein
MLGFKHSDLSTTVSSSTRILAGSGDRMLMSTLANRFLDYISDSFCFATTSSRREITLLNDDILLRRLSGQNRRLFTPVVSTISKLSSLHGC